MAEVQSPFNAQKVTSGLGHRDRFMTAELPQSPEEIEDFKKDILDSPYAVGWSPRMGGAALFWSWRA